MTVEEITYHFPNTIEYLAHQVAQLFYQPTKNMFFIVTQDKKRIYKTFDELKEIENDLKPKTHKLKEVTHIQSNSIKL